ncbi:MAG: hydroxyacid dehydrogenase, partial [Candidatus Electrothrix sp. AR1]|nr:hydroxyacid dehydrogenase [Candidatus Electrothrix sp. AR1]
GWGSISKKRMESITLAEYDQFDERRKSYEAEIADRQDEEELRQLESRVKSRKRQGK